MPRGPRGRRVGRYTNNAPDENCDSDNGASGNVEKENKERRDKIVTQMDKIEDDDGINLEPSVRVNLNHPLDQVIGDITEPIKTRRQVRNEVNYLCYTSLLEPKNVKKVLTDEHWITAMHEELDQFVYNDVWTLVLRPNNVNVIGTKWIFKNKSDEFGTITRNKARLAAQGYT